MSNNNLRGVMLGNSLIRISVLGADGGAVGFFLGCPKEK